MTRNRYHRLVHAFGSFKRARARDETGSILIEALVGMAMVTVVVAGSLGVSSNVQASLRHHESVDAVDQYLTGLAEETMALPWASVAHCGAGTDEGAGSSTTLVDWPDAECPPVTIERTREHTVEDVDITITTTVDWVGTPAQDPSGFGRKQVTMTATWTPAGDTRQRSVTETITRTATPSEAIPTEGTL